jgi:hypothetical protein
MKNTALTYWDMRRGTRITRNGLMKSADNCWSKSIRHTRHILVHKRQQKEQNMRRKGNGHTQHVEKKKAVYQPTINCNRTGILGEKPKTGIQNSTKDKRWIKPRTDLFKDKK